MIYEFQTEKFVTKGLGINFSNNLRCRVYIKVVRGGNCFSKY